MGEGTSPTIFLSFFLCSTEEPGSWGKGLPRQSFFLSFFAVQRNLVHGGRDFPDNLSFFLSLQHRGTWFMGEGTFPSPLSSCNNQQTEGLKTFSEKT